MKRIYLDYSATTPLDGSVLKKMLPYFSREFANPASIHSAGQSALKAVEDARHEIASIINARASEIVFTSGATESNNVALRGVLKALKKKGDKRNHIITTAIEHSSIIEPLAELTKEGYSVTRLAVDANGILKPSVLQKAITDKTILVSIGYVNSEVGTIQAIDKLGRIIRKINERRYGDWLKSSSRKRGEKPRPIYFHTDATQAFNTIACNAGFLNVDLMSLSAHKVYGPKGVGLLYVKRDTPLEPLVYGGHQERNLRSGTLNVPGIIGFAEALKQSERLRKRFNTSVAKLRNSFIQKLIKTIPTIKVTVPSEYTSSFHAHIIFPGVSGDALLAELDEKGIAVSTGSACASGDLEASPVLIALGYDEATAASALRFTFGRMTTAADIQMVISRLSAAYRSCLKRG